ncbi:DUF349 domain-containing protein [Algoriphagus namhaensis]
MTDQSKELPEKGKVTQDSETTESTSKSVTTNEEAPSKDLEPISEVPASESEKEEQQVQAETIDAVEANEQPTEQEELPSVKDESENASSEEAPKTEEAAPKSNAPVKEEKVEETSAEGEADDEEESSDEDDEEVDETEIDLSNLNKTELLALLKEKVGGDQPSKKDRLINDIRTAYQAIAHQERDEALAKFKEEGGSEDDFDFKPSDEDKEFDTHYFEHKRKINTARKEAEKQKEKNLELKNEILDRLRELVDGEETTLSMNAIKSIQEEWKSIGPVPNAQNRSLWANYNALMDRFYDNRSIYFELKELDRKKNLKAKTELCEKAESLKDEADLQTAIKALNELHEEYKHLGPVPREEQEPLWQRFKAASDAVYDRRKEFYESQKEVFLQNQEQKEKLIDSLKEFTEFKADRIKEWNSKTKEILAIQKAWEQIGPVPREAGKEINKTFWAGFKEFFHNKNLFFKQLDQIRAENQEKAEQLIAQAEELKESTDWQKTASQLIGLQKEWKKLGPTPEKTRDSLYKKFKNACDTFFDNRRNANKASNSEYESNLVKKQELCAKIEELAQGESPSEDELTALVNEFNELGFVPRKNMKEIQSQFKAAVEKYLEKLDGTDFDQENFLFKLNLNRIQSDPNAVRTMNKKEHGIRKQISDLENNITLWKTNLEFFAASKTADKLKDQFDVKIQKAEEEIEKLKQKLSILREF